MRAREVDVRVRLEDELLLVAIHADCEPAAVALACLPGESLPADAERDSTGGAGLGLGEGERELADRVPVGHGWNDSLGARMKTWIGIGASFVVAAILGVLHYADANAVVQFVVAIVALALLAWTVGVGTEMVGARFGPATTGVLQSTLGNLPELFIVVFALRAGEIVVAQTSILGSLLANALLILGLAIIAGAYRSDDGIMRFHTRLPNDTTMLLMLVVFMIAIISTSISLGDKASDNAETISVIGAVLILCVYGAWLVNYLRAGAQQEPAIEEEQRRR